MSKYEAPRITPGSKMAVQIGDELVEGTVHSVRYTSAQPEVRQQPKGWRKIIRALTPARWRKSLPIVRPYQPADVEVIPKSAVGRRAELVAEDMQRHFKVLGLTDDRR